MENTTTIQQTAALKVYTSGEEIANSVTHGIGACLSVAALVLLIIRAANNAPANQTASYVVGFTLFGVSLILLYLISTLYHALVPRKAKKIFAILDHSAIYVLIAGTYTSYCLSVLYGAVGWTLFGIIWFLAVLGTVSYAIYGARLRWFSLGLYLLMGWLALCVAGRLHAIIPAISWNMLLLGGICYTIGCIFFVLKKIRWMHSIWHLFVLAGSILHFFSVYFLV